MTGHQLGAERLRYHLHDLSSNVARRLIAVLDGARDGSQELSHEFNAVVCEITAIQRELVHELTGPHMATDVDIVSMARLLELQHRAVRLLEHLEALLAQPAFDHLPPNHAARQKGEAGRVHVPIPARPPRSYPEAYDDPRAYVPFEARAAAAPPGLRRAAGMSMPLVAGSGTLQPRFLAVPMWGLFGAALAAAFALSATVGAHILSGDPAAISSEEEQAAARGDKLGGSPAVPVDLPSEAVDRPRPRILVADPPSPPASAPKIALVTETGALPEAAPRGRGSAERPSDPSFVAVLGTHDDETAAREAFVRLKEGYPAILGAAEAQIEKVEGQGGKSWQRLSALPLASRDEAKDLCRRLGEAGHTGCWVKPQAQDTELVFVAVLVTRNDPAVAQEAFGQLKVRYPALLGRTQWQVEAVHMQDGATWHRVSTLPAVSRGEAKALCRRLRKAGHPGCWVKPQS